MRRLSSRGFTIIELLIATIVFSLVLLILTGAIVQFNRIYYKSTVDTKTKEVARTVVDDIARNVQFSNSHTATSGAPTGYFCAGDYQYVYTKDQLVEGSNHALVAIEGCDSTITDPNTAIVMPKARELLGAKMKLVDIAVSGGNPTKIFIEIAYGDEYTAVNGCPAIRLGGQFCAGAQLSTNVTSRL